MFYVKLMNHRKALFNKHFKNSNKKWKKVDALTKKMLFLEKKKL